MKSALLPILLAVAQAPAADFEARWDALNPPTVEIEDDPPLKPHAVRVVRHITCHHVWFSRNHHRFWRCEK